MKIFSNPYGQLLAENSKESEGKSCSEKQKVAYSPTVVLILEST